MAGLLYLGEAAELYRVSRDTLERAVRAGRLTVHRRPHDRRTWLRRSELDALFGARE